MTSMKNMRIKVAVGLMVAVLSTLGGAQVAAATGQPLDNDLGQFGGAMQPLKVTYG
jgi:hypothetical protein